MSPGMPSRSDHNLPRVIITIDGPAGTGKSTVAHQLAKRLGLEFLDTGAMYRAAALVALDAEIDPTDPVGYYLVGSYYRDAEKWDQAFAAYETSLEKDPHYMPALYQLGRTGVFSGQNLDRCIECMEFYLTMEPPKDSPTWADARWRLGMLYEKKGDQAKARAEFETALSIEPEHKNARKALDNID